MLFFGGPTKKANMELPWRKKRPCVRFSVQIVCKIERGLRTDPATGFRAAKRDRFRWIFGPEQLPQEQAIARIQASASFSSHNPVIDECWRKRCSNAECRFRDGNLRMCGQRSYLKIEPLPLTQSRKTVAFKL